ncbi:MAG: small ribosomal subunit Rsm22 family protein [Treponema sp.]|nr:small ribosomal subunit Rsm22 family protein [Treponema sp.]
MEAGKKLFFSLCKTESNIVNWNINLIKKDINFRKADLSAFGHIKTNKKNKTASLVSAVNIFNEIYENLSHNNTEGLRRIASYAAKLMHNEASGCASILTVEPGVPQSGRFISFLRDSFLELSRLPVSPCTHISSCPLSHGYNIAEQKNKSHINKKWCHISYKASNIPKELNNLSLAAGLPKERITFSYLLAGEVSCINTLQHDELSANGQNTKKNEKTRIISDIFQLPDNLIGCYGCSAKGLVLLKSEKNKDNIFTSGNIITPIFDKNGQRDKKSGALIAKLSREK